ncbi:MAG: LysR family transcriptional regulator [Pseudonocardia sp. SCN 72-86]|nr:MAG: LysR family transcriptional regulator [Pseudonocardia sp. SCN 72-86]
MTVLPDLESLQLLTLVARRGSLTLAAADVGISQPMASKRVAALERRLGLQLIERSRRGSSLTPAGALVCSWAEKVLEDVETLVDGVAALRRDTAAHLTVAASLTVAEHLLPAWVGDLRRRTPDLRVALRVTNSSRVCELVRSGHVDLGFIESPGEFGGLRSKVVAHDKLVLVVPPTHVWARRAGPVTARELAGTPLISREVGSGTRETVQRALSSAAEVALADPLLELGSAAAIRSAVVAGVGPAVLSELAIGADLVGRAIVEVATEGLDLTRELRAVWRAGERPTGPAVALLGRATGQPSRQ